MSRLGSRAIKRQSVTTDRSKSTDSPSRTCSKVASDMERLFQSKTDADVTFVLPDGEIRAHKQILIARVVYFERMFACGLQEATTYRVVVEDSNAESFEAFLHFVYCGRLPDNFDMTNILILADKYDIPALLDQCVPKMRTRMRNDSPELIFGEVSQVLELAKRLGTSSIKKILEEELEARLKLERSLGVSRMTINTLILAHVFDCPRLKKNCLVKLNSNRSSLRFGNVGEKLKEYPDLMLEILEFTRVYGFYCEDI